MTKIIYREEYDNLWQKTNKITLQKSINNSGNKFQKIQYFPSELGEGYIKIFQLREIQLIILNYQLHEDLTVIENSNEEDNYWELGFNISGNRSSKKSGESFLHSNLTNENDNWTWKTYCNEPIIKVDLHLDQNSEICQDIRQYCEELPNNIKQMLLKNGDFNNYFDDINIITPAMKTILQQIINCPYKDSIKKFYLESKCLELITLKLEQIREKGEIYQRKKQLKLDDIERIYLARNILNSCLQSPPSLKELARQVSLNDYKLKIGFRQVFGTTVFGYLLHLRMEKARELLDRQEMSIKQVAEAVGYINQSHFASAFRKLYGVNPKSFTKNIYF